MTLFPAAGKLSDVFRKHFEIPKSNLASIWRPIRFRNFRSFRNNHASVYTQGKREISKFRKNFEGLVLCLQRPFPCRLHPSVWLNIVHTMTTVNNVFSPNICYCCIIYHLHS